MTDPTTPADAGSPIEPPASDVAPSAPTDAPPPPAAAPVVPEAPPAYAGQPAYPAYAGQPEQSAAPAPGAPVGVARDVRPRTMALVALILGVVGLAFSLGGFIPIPFLSLVLAGLGGVLLLTALIMGIVAVASKKHGGKGLGIGAIVVSVIGGIIWIFAITVSVLWLGLAFATSTNSQPAPAVSASAPQNGGEQPASGTYDEAAYLAEVRPQVLAIMQTIEPTITDEQLTAVYTDEMLVGIGRSLVALPEASRVGARDAFISSTVDSSEGAFTQDTAAQFFDAIIAAGDKYLVQ